MMRNDREDLEDIRFLVEQEEISHVSLDAAFQGAAKLEIPELQAIFEKMKPVVREMALGLEAARAKKGYSKNSSIPSDPDWWIRLTGRSSGEKSIEKDRGIEL
jgi:hypothetical protein